MRRTISQIPAAQTLLLQKIHSLSPHVERALPIASISVRFFHKSVKWSSESVHSTTYHLSAAYTAKHHLLKPTKNIFTFNPRSKAGFPPINDEVNLGDKHRWRSDSGHDAFFVSPVGNSEHVAFGVVRHMN